MLSRLKHHGKKYQPTPRLGHTSVTVGDRLYVWAGWQKNIPKTHSGGDKLKLTAIIEVLSLRTGEWNQLPTGGMPPLGVAYYACTSIEEDLYYFGGRCGHAGCHHNTVNRLNTVTMRWKEMNPSTSSGLMNAPMKKAQCGMISFRSKNKDYLFTVGGYGVLPDRHQPQASYVPKRGKPEYGWTNEAHIFDLQSKEWIIPETSGVCLPACGNFSFTKISDNQAIIIGGFNSSGRRMDSIFTADLSDDSVFWSKLSHQDKLNTTLPGPTCDQVASVIIGLLSNSQPYHCVVAVGGEDDNGATIASCWVLQLPVGTWKKVSIPSSSAARLYHSMSAFTVGPHCVWLVMFGGVNQLVDMKDWQDQPMVSDTLIIELVLGDDGVMTSNTVFDSSQSNTSEDYQRRLLERLLQGRREWVTASNSCPPLTQEKEDTSLDQSSEGQASLDKVNSVITPDEDTKCMKVMNQCNTASDDNEEKALDVCQGDTLDDKQEASEASQKVNVLTEEVSEAKSKVDKLQQELAAVEKIKTRMLSEAEEKIEQLRKELQSQSTTQVQPNQWEVSEDDVQLTEKLVLKGDWGVVKVAEYHGAKLAAMKLQHIVPSADFNIAMNTARSLHHPGLLQFMGATPTSQLMLVEHVSITLAKQLEAGSLNRSQIISIGIDLASSLSYLHRRSPDHIVHGYISSNTVLLEKCDQTWRAKLFNPLLLHPIPPRSIIASPYTASEGTSAESSKPESDVFSFGVLLMEMCTGEKPTTVTVKREQQIRRLNWSAMSAIVLQCTKQQSSERPSISSVIHELKKL